MNEHDHDHDHENEAKGAKFAWCEMVVPALPSRCCALEGQHRLSVFRLLSLTLWSL